MRSLGPRPLRFGSLVLAAASVSASESALSSPVSLLFQNSLNWTQNSVSHPGLLLTSVPSSQSSASALCGSFSESLVDTTSANASSKTAYASSLNFQIEIGAIKKNELLWVAPAANLKGKCEAVVASTLKTTTVACSSKLAALCTNSAPYGVATASDDSKPWQTEVTAGGRTFTGYRDFASFRFLGIPYANPPERWEYSTVYSGSQKSFNATVAGAHCVQSGDTDVSEDCLFLNIFSPYLPGSAKVSYKLKPVMLWIHGGAFTSGTGSDPTFDGGSFASRGDVVLVTINYRLSTLGFLALDDGEIKGNYGLADQVTALKWVKANIAAFGGDPDHVTIFGQSAGAASVRALIASPQAEGLFHGAIAESNLAGADYATTYSDYLSISEEVTLAANKIIAETNCTSSNAAAVRACLKKVPATTLVALADVARYVVVDGKYITSSGLPLSGKLAGVSKVPTIWGWMDYDAAAFIGYPTASETVTQGLVALGVVNATMATSIAESGFFPTPNSGNVTLDVFNVSARVATDIELRCLDQATVVAGVKNGVFPKAYAYQFDRSYQSYNWSPNSPVCEAPITSSNSLGDPNLPYFQCHSGELYYVFGTLGQFSLPLRDAEDLAFGQYVLDAWASFGRTFDPNPDLAWLKARGPEYSSTIEMIEKNGKWEAATTGSKTPVRLLDGTLTKNAGWQEVEQCNFLGYPLDYYE